MALRTLRSLRHSHRYATRLSHGRAANTHSPQRCTALTNKSALRCWPAFSKSSSAFNRFSSNWMARFSCRSASRSDASDSAWRARHQPKSGRASPAGSEAHHRTFKMISFFTFSRIRSFCRCRRCCSRSRTRFSCRWSGHAYQQRNRAQPTVAHAPRRCAPILPPSLCGTETWPSSSSTSAGSSSSLQCAATTIAMRARGATTLWCACTTHHFMGSLAVNQVLLLRLVESCGDQCKPTIPTALSSPPQRTISRSIICRSMIRRVSARVAAISEAESWLCVDRLRNHEASMRQATQQHWQQAEELTLSSRMRNPW